MEQSHRMLRHSKIGHAVIRKIFVCVIALKRNRKKVRVICHLGAKGSSVFEFGIFRLASSTLYLIYSPFPLTSRFFYFLLAGFACSERARESTEPPI